MANKKYEVMFSIAGKVAASFNSAFKGANKAIDDANKRTKALKENMTNLQGIAQKGLAVGSIGLVGAGVAAKEAIAFESAMADVKKVFSGTDAELKALNDEIINMSTRLPMAANDIAKIAAAAGQAGIATKEITRFTEDAVKMGVAFDISAEEAGQSMAELRTAFKMNQDEVVALADKINYLGNTTPAAAKGITEIVQRIGPLGEVGGFASGSIAALGATIRGMGVQEEVAATGIKNMMLSLVAGESATKSQAAAYKSLGLDSTKVAKSMQVDSEKTVLTVLKAVSKLDKYKQAATLKELFGSESLGSIAPLLTNMAALEKNLEAVADKTKYAGSMEAEYAARAATTENQIILTQNTIKALAIEFGSTLLPVINEGLKAFQNVIQNVRAWAKENPELANTIFKIALGASALVAGLSALALGAIAFIGPIMMVVGALSKFGFVITIIKSVGTAFLWLGRIFLMNPIGLAITAVIAVIWLLWKNWDTVCKYVGIAWEGIKGFFTSGIGNISATIVNWSPIGLFYRAFSAVMNWFGVSLPSTFTEFGRNLLQGLANGIKNGVSAAVNAAGEAVEAVKNKVKNFFGINSPSKLFAQFGEWNMEGLAIGMQAGAPMAENASDKALSGVLPKANGQSLTNNSSMNSNYTVTIQQTIQGGNNVAEQAKQGALSAMDEFKSYNNRNMRTSFA